MSVTRDQFGHQPYYPISQFYRDRFGAKVYKIPVTTADDCPNRRGLKGMQTCVFCDPWGSAARVESLSMDLRSQITQFRDRIAKLYKAEQFLIYFQAYTNTFAKLSSIRQQFEIAMEYPFVKGLVVGTRPDCISKGLFKLWNEYSQETFLSIELGVQSFNNDHLAFLRRGHTAEESIEAIHKIKEETSVDLGVHFIFGIPGETDEDIVRSAELTNSLPINNVKLHNLHVLENTPLADMYRKGEFQPIELDEYARKVALFLQHLNPTTAVHRLTAVSSRPEELLAPQWTAQKMASFQACIDWMNQREVFQGQKYFQSSNPIESVNRLR